MNYNLRIKKLCGSLPGRAILLSSKSNLFYFLGITFGEDAFAVVYGNQAVVFTDARYESEAKRQLKDRIPFVIARNTSVLRSLAEYIMDVSVSSIVCEGALPVSVFDKLKGFLKGCEFDYDAALDRAIYEIRIIKDEDEIKLMRANFKLHRNALRIWSGKAIGLSEKEAAFLWHEIVLSLGADGPAFDTIVAVGPSSAQPHHAPSRQILSLDKIFLLDSGLRKNGYNTDVTRVFSQNYKRPMKRALELVNEAHIIAASMAKPGVEAKAIDRAVREFFSKNKAERHFKHSLGHGVGVDVHEGPYLSPNSSDILKEGMVFTIEPGLYYDGRFGVRVEDVFLVEENGVARISYC